MTFTEYKEQYKKDFIDNTQLNLTSQVESLVKIMDIIRDYKSHKSLIKFDSWRKGIECYQNLIEFIVKTYNIKLFNDSLKLQELFDVSNYHLFNEDDNVGINEDEQGELLNQEVQHIIYLRIRQTQNLMLHLNNLELNTYFIQDYINHVIGDFKREDFVKEKIYGKLQGDYEHWLTYRSIKGYYLHLYEGEDRVMIMSLNSDYMNGYKFIKNDELYEFIQNSYSELATHIHKKIGTDLFDIVKLFNNLFMKSEQHSMIDIIEDHNPYCEI